VIDREATKAPARDAAGNGPTRANHDGGNVDALLIAGTADRIAARLADLPRAMREDAIAKLHAMRGSSFVGLVFDAMDRVRAPKGAAHFQGAAEAEAEVANPARAELPPELMGEPIGTQDAHDPRATPDHSAGAKVADDERDIAVKRAELEKPRPTLTPGGTAPAFITRSGTERTDTYQRGGHLTPVRYLPTVFHLPNAMLHDISLATTLDEIEAIWSVYLSNVPGAPKSPWSEGQEQRVGTPRRGRLVLPDGAAARMIDPARIVEWETWEGDGTGSVRKGILRIALFDRAPHVEGLPELLAGATNDVAEDENTQRKRVIPTLRLPLTKAPHIYRYQEAMAAGKLIHDPKYKRGNPDQGAIWQAAMLPRAMTTMDPDVLRRGLKLTNGSNKKLVIPPWSRTADFLPMSVDHIIELQVTRPEDRSTFNSMENLELLDLSTNLSTGPTLQGAIEVERRRLAAETNDPGWRERTIVWAEVVIEGGGTQGHRWSQDEIALGEHILALETMRGVAP